ncbi:putative sugar transporter [Aureobasidium pullulans]|uniref:Sugar transporter n=2 Tax=Aureobasidium pullulans TaxID=5580 RepID=A0A4S9N689_AURPU|nr:putative sugar transporter [Aureobasidium pullulans EXF-150]THV70543.1 putative sugar transporter [Aureobasidium pullulans]KEQ85381.1 putative sugar transporter [Aureobasidium pullulans EXF-150]THV84341.1 putative sugar transporter [Aureobasidium pullulans]THV92422.1 putative sugar transporter [Aureobasidium pullulans]THW16919.1 putative sugar transporter [Aureobasidium pullulans]
MGKGVKGAASGEQHENIEMFDPAQQGSYMDRREMTKDQMEDAVRAGSVPHVNTSEAVDIAKNGGWEVDALMTEMQKEIDAQGGDNNGHFDLEFANPKYFTYLIVAFASMGGMLSGLDQSLISGANLFLPGDLGLNDRQNSLVNSGMSLGAVGGAIILSPANEYLGRRWAIILSCILYTIGGALEAAAMNYGMIIAARVILGFGVGLEGGTVPVYVAETVERRYRGNMVSLYQFNIALGEVLGYAVAAMFVTVPGNWRYILGSSLLFSTIMGIGMLYMPESPRFLMHKGKPVEAFKVWKRIRGIEQLDSREEFYVMKMSQEQEDQEVAAGRGNAKYPWMDLFTEPRARRAFVYANVMIFLGQFTGINAITYFMSTLMQNLGFDKYQSNYMSLVGGGSLLIGTIPAVLYMERCGRRFWACATLPVFFVGLIIAGASQYAGGQNAQMGVYLTGLVIYEIFFGTYACLTWVIPAESYPTYLRSYGMTTSDGWLFLSSFIVTYNFTGMSKAFTNIGLTAGFYGGIAFVGWFYQLFFMPETKDKTLEEIDLIFSQPTSKLVAQNWKNVKETTNDLLRFRFKKVFIDAHNAPAVDFSQGKHEVGHQA